MIPTKLPKDVELNDVVEAYNNLLNFTLSKLVNIPYIYAQVDSTLDDNIIQIKAPVDTKNSRGILYVLPMEAIDHSAGSEQKPKLRLTQGKKDPVDFYIKKEKGDGTIVDIGNGDLAPNKLAMFRFCPYDPSIIILINSPVHGDVSLGNIKSTGAEFTSVPSVKFPDNSIKPLVTKNDFDEYKQNIAETYQEKILIGTDEPEEMFKRASVNTGSLYMQIVEKEE